MDKEKFQQLIRLATSRETSADANGWSEENPLWGHCAVVSLLAQDYFGGGVYRASLEGTEFSDSGSHYRNEVHDFTQEQFGDVVLNLFFEPRTREYLLSNDNTRLRYNLLKAAFERLLADL